MKTCFYTKLYFEQICSPTNGLLGAAQTMYKLIMVLQIIKLKSARITLQAPFSKSRFDTKGSFYRVDYRGQKDGGQKDLSNETIPEILRDS